MTVNLVSVIVPVFNVEEYLPECIESILAQTYQKYELILVDDGSTDNSGLICDKYADANSIISVIHKVNGGLSSARNAGIDIAKGDYFAFIDSDDMVHPDYLRLLVSAVEMYHSDLVACSFVKGQNCCWENRNHGVDIREKSEILNRMWDNDVVVTVAWNKLYHKKFFYTFNLRYPDGKIHEDMFFTPQVLAVAEKMVIIEEQLYFYRERPNSIMTAAFSEKRLDLLEAILFRIHFFEERGLKQLARMEWDGYLRKACQMYSIMKSEQKQQYEETMKQLKKSIVSGTFGLKSRASLRARLKVILNRY